MSHPPENVSINSIGEALTHIAGNQISPELTGDIVGQLAACQQSLESLLGRESSAGSEILSPLGDVAAKLVLASEAQAKATDGLTGYLASIGYIGQSAAHGTTVSAEFTTEPISRERPMAGDNLFIYGADGVIRLCDLQTREIMLPGEIPKSLLADPELRKGFEFWQEHGSKVQFNLLLARHSVAKDLMNSDIDLHAVAQRLSEVNGPLYLECIGTTSQIQRFEDRHNRISHSTCQKMLESGDEQDASVVNDPGASFTNQVLAQIMTTGVEVVIPDYRIDSTRPVDIALDTSRRIRCQSSLYDSMPILVGYVSYRDAYLVGKIGADLARRYEETGIVPSGTALLVGGLHEGIGLELKRYGVPVVTTGGVNAEAAYVVHCIKSRAISPRGIVRYILGQVPSDL
ncbi:MAG TPA: hypothetical protein VMR45_00270 [Patescibacteria group bacterium]|nr:hypothetical protein [Patescibacteria group bacterium]